MASITDKPGYHIFAFHNLNLIQYKTYIMQYYKAKASGIRCVYINTGAYLFSPAKIVFTTTSKNCKFFKKYP